MTALLTNCPFCNSNFMLLNTESANGECVVCGKNKKFSKDEITQAETRRDSISEAYISRMQMAFESKDYDTMKVLAKEVADKGISSWYAWFCIGWSDLHEKKVTSAFEDFRLAVLFLDEENFDEFYELTMEAVLNSLEESARNDEAWGDEETSLVDFTGTLFERFEHLCEDGDFMTDLMLRIDTLAQDIDKASTGGNLIKEVMMLVLDYLSGNTFVPDRQALLYNAKQAVEDLGAMMQIMAKDGSLPRNTIDIWAPGFVDLLDRLIAMGDRMEAEFSEEQLLSLCDYWGMEDYLSVFNLLQNAFEYHLGFMLSNGRNKGVEKKRDKALEDYEKAFRRPLDEGLEIPEEGDVEFDQICPECGKYLKADDNGLVACECGFKSRIVTEDIVNLPENVNLLIPIGKKALDDRDPVMLNNVGERILEFDPDNWYGPLFIAESCILDREMPEAIMLFSQAAEHLTKEDVLLYANIVVNDLGEALATMSDENQHMSAVFLPSLLENINNSPAKDLGIPLRLIDKMASYTYDDTFKAFGATVVIPPILTYEILHHTGLNYQKDMCARIIVLMDAVEEGVKAVKDDPANLKDETITFIRTNRDLFSYMIAGIDSRMKDMDDEERGYISGHWGANIESYQKMVQELTEAFSGDEDAVYKPNSNSILKSKHIIDTYLDSYMEAGKR
ncbi:MAG: hypothetical protein E7Z65_07735 [Thermoplasmata archaeon]|nr:hypothetical protein [Thermoplasmata archaeon]